MSKEYFTHQIVLDTEDFNIIGDHRIKMNECLKMMNLEFKVSLYKDIKIIGVLNELSFPKGNNKKISILLLCEGVIEE